MFSINPLVDNTDSISKKYFRPHIWTRGFFDNCAPQLLEALNNQESAEDRKVEYLRKVANSDYDIMLDKFETVSEHTLLLIRLVRERGLLYDLIRNFLFRLLDVFIWNDCNLLNYLSAMVDGGSFTLIQQALLCDIVAEAIIRSENCKQTLVMCYMNNRLANAIFETSCIEEEACGALLIYFNTTILKYYNFQPSLALKYCIAANLINTLSYLSTHWLFQKRNPNRTRIMNLLNLLDLPLIPLINPNCDQTFYGSMSNGDYNLCQYALFFSSPMSRVVLQYVVLYQRFWYSNLGYVYSHSTFFESQMEGIFYLFISNDSTKVQVALSLLNTALVKLLEFPYSLPFCPYSFQTYHPIHLVSLLTSLAAHHYKEVVLEGREKELDIYSNGCTDNLYLVCFLRMFGIFDNESTIPFCISAMKCLLEGYKNLYNLNELLPEPQPEAMLFINQGKPISDVDSVENTEHNLDCLNYDDKVKARIRNGNILEESDLHLFNDTLHTSMYALLTTIILEKSKSIILHPEARHIRYARILFYELIQLLHILPPYVSLVNLETVISILSFFVMIMASRNEQLVHTLYLWRKLFIPSFQRIAASLYENNKLYIKMMSNKCPYRDEDDHEICRRLKEFYRLLRFVCAGCSIEVRN